VFAGQRAEEALDDQVGAQAGYGADDGQGHQLPPGRPEPRHQHDGRGHEDADDGQRQRRGTQDQAPGVAG
jgi:hypothetical protein